MTYLIQSPFDRNDNKNIAPLDFYMTDDKKLFDKNIKHLQGWKYADKQITYKLNSFGYRMDKELDEVNLDNYFAFFGCSNTVGIGLALEDTFSYKIAKQANVDYVNGAIGGASVDFVFYNFTTLFSNVSKLPKAVVIYWPDPTRACYWYKDYLVFYLIASMPEYPTHWHDAYKSFILEDSHMKNRFIMYRQAITQMCKSNNIPLFEFTSNYLKDQYFNPNGIDIIGVENVPLGINYSNMIDWINDAHARDIRLDESMLPNIKTIGGAHPGTYQQDRILIKFFETMGDKI